MNNPYIWGGSEPMGAVSVPRSAKGRSNGSEILSAGSVQVLGQSVYYEAAGTAEEGPTMLLLHESGGSAATFRGQLGALAQNARCLVPDLPGHGRSEGGGHSNVAGYRNDVLAFLDALAIRWQVVVVGVCLGAAVAVDLARAAPDRVAGLVLTGVSPGGRASEWTRMATDRGEAPENFVVNMFSRSASPRLLDEQLLRWRLTSPVARSGDLMAMARYAMDRRLTEVCVPTLLVAGEEDPLFSPAEATSLISQLPHMRMIPIARAGCLTAIEQPAAFSQVVADFVAELRPANPMAHQLRRQGGYRRNSRPV